MAAKDQALLGIITAISLEGRLFINAFPDQQHYRLSVCGIGAENARHAADELIHQGVTHLVSFGFAGALDPALAAGTVVIPKTIVTEDEQCFSLSSGWHAAVTNKLNNNIDFTIGSLLQSREIATNPSDKSRLFTQHEAICVDMESGALAQTAQHAGVPFLVLRAISDETIDTLPEIVKIFGNSNHGWTEVVMGLVKSPGDIRYLPKLIRNYRLARTALTRVLQLAGPLLCAC